jgi:SPP1 family predicted phage head-tail adaptor
VAAVRCAAQPFLKGESALQVGKLNKRVQIISRKAQTDDLGFDTLQDVVHCTCWASIEPARGKVFYEMERKADTEYSKITIRWRPGITHDMKVKYQNNLYDIDTIVDPYMRHESLELYCTEEIRGQDNEQQ